MHFRVGFGNQWISVSPAECGKQSFFFFGRVKRCGVGVKGMKINVARRLFPYSIRKLMNDDERKMKVGGGIDFIDCIHRILISRIKFDKWSTCEPSVEGWKDIRNWQTEGGKLMNSAFYTNPKVKVFRSTKYLFYFLRSEGVLLTLLNGQCLLQRKEALKKLVL